MQRPRCPVRVVAPAALGLVVSMSPAFAQSGADIDLQGFRPAMDSRGYITVNGSPVLAPGEPSFGLVTTWGRGLLRLERGDQRYEVDDIITPSLVGAVGFRLFGLALEAGAALPFAIMAGDRAPDSDGGTPGAPSDDDAFRFDGQGLADASLHLKWQLVGRSPSSGLGLAVIGSVSLPTAAAKSWLGDGAAVPQMTAVADLVHGRFTLAANAGLRWRTGERFQDDPPATGAAPRPATGRVVESGSAIPLGLAASYSILPGRFDAIAEVFGAAPLGGENYAPLEALGGVKVYLARSSYLSFGGGTGLLDRGGNPDARAFLAIVFEPRTGDRDGDGIRDDIDECIDRPEDKDGFEDADGCPDAEDGDRDRDRIADRDDLCPDAPEDRDGFEDEDGCPDADDRDGDRIVHRDDLCPDRPEDRDGFRDEDGCPDPDNDGDRILDRDDLCIDRPEVYNTVEDEDGCPDHGLVVETVGEIEILDVIEFEFDSAVIQERSHALLRAVAMTIELSPAIRLVEIQGHTDERGAAAYNLDLSRRRAESVLEFLVAEGIARERLVARGYGETRPTIRAHTESAWAVNRRVQFIVVRRDRAR